VEHAVSLQLTLPPPMGRGLGTARKSSHILLACDNERTYFQDALDGYIPGFLHVE
jgi:hypothetical protein